MSQPSYRDQSTRRVLVIAGLPIRSALAFTLGQYPHVQLDLGSHGEENRSCHAPPHVVVVDWDLPGLRLQCTLGRFRVMRPRPVIIVVAGSSKKEFIARQAGVDHFIHKDDAGHEFLELLLNASLQQTHE